LTGIDAEDTFIDLGVLGGDDRGGDGPRPPVRLGRPLLAGLLAMACLVALGASARGQPVLGDPLWTSSVSLNGFTVGATNLYVATPDGTVVSALDLRTGQPRWSRAIVELPEPTTELDRAVTVVVTRPKRESGANPRPPASTITLVRAATGEQIAQTSGDYYLPGADGGTVLVFGTRTGDPDSCVSTENSCQEITAWNAAAGSVVWRLRPAPNLGVLASTVDGRVRMLAEFDAGGTVRMHDASTGAVTGTISLPIQPFTSIDLVRDVLVTANRGPDGITLTGYRPPSPGPSWSVVVPDLTPPDESEHGGVYTHECGPDVCLTTIGAGTRLVDLSTGAVTASIPFDVAQRLGSGVFLASPLRAEGGTGSSHTGLVVRPDGRPVATITATALVDWEGSGNRALVAQEGPARTGFLVIDDQGGLHPLGSVPGTGLTCHARADILGCSDHAGSLRVWRLPV
jgi:hypothetical protein